MRTGGIQDGTKLNRWSCFVTLMSCGENGLRQGHKVRLVSAGINF